MKNLMKNLLLYLFLLAAANLAAQDLSLDSIVVNGQ